MRKMKYMVLAGMLAISLAGCGSAGNSKGDANETEAVSEDTGAKDSEIADESKVEDFEYESLGEGTIQITGYHGTATTVVIPEEIDGLTVEAIGKSAFYANDNEEIKVVKIPASVKSIFKDAFYECAAIEHVEFSEGLEEIESGAFEGCTSLKEFNMPDSVLKIGNGVCRMAGIESLTISSNIEEIPEGAFAVCSNLKGTVTIPSNVKTIDEMAFQHCSNVESFVMEEGVESIGERVFGDCTNLKSATIPESVTSIDIAAFMGSCDNLTLKVKAGSEAEKFAGSEIPYETY